ncbi:hypothetical protein Hdeb2414_s0002g00052231 [Helianthus debilis subsp. tardiflorus]
MANTQYRSGIEFTRPKCFGFQAKDKTTEESRIGICIFDDMTEQCCEADLKYYFTFLPFS